MKKLLILLALLPFMPIIGQSNLNNDSYIRYDGNAMTSFKSKFYQGEIEISKDEYVSVIKEKCPQAYKKFKKGKRLFGSSFGVLGGSLLLVAGGGVIYATTDNIAPLCILGGVGILADVTLVPIMIFRSKRYERKSVELYNEQCSNKSTSNIELGLGVNSKGLGLALRF